MPKWLEGKTVVVKLRDGAIHGPRGASAYMWCKSPCDHTSGDIIAYRIVGEQEDQRPELPNEGRNQEQEDVEEGLALLRKHSWDLYEKSGASENGDDPEQFASGNPVPFVEKPRSPSDATYPREAVQRAYEHGLRDGVDDTPGGPPAERRHRNELAARTLTPVPGMDDFMHDVLREARRRRYQELLVLEDVRDPESQITKPALKHLFDMADAMIEQEDSE